MKTQARRVLSEIFGYDAFRGQQEAVVHHVLDGGDALVLMPTGGGKSLCYQIPALVRPGTGVVISPLIALMQDQVEALRQSGVRAAFLNSTLSARDNRALEADLRHGALDLLYVAPERLLRPDTLALLESIDIALFAIDEAHCVSQWGHDFRSDYLRLTVLHERFPAVPRLACTATADERTREEIVTRLALEEAGLFVSGFDRPNIRYRIAEKDGPRRQLLRFLQEEHPRDSGIVYCMSRKRTESTAAHLNEKGFHALPYHAGMHARDRQQNQERFLREEGQIIVATIAFGMGIDKPDVRFVAHLDMPKSIEAYYQETGRAGRDGEPADAWLLYGLQDVVLISQLMAKSDADEAHKRIERQRLDAMLGLCEITTCRRRALLAYFGDHLDGPCGNCDTCLEPVDTWDGTVAVQKALSNIYRTGQRFGVAHLVDVLRGEETERISRFGHDRVSTYGIGRNLDGTTWRSVYRQVLARGYAAVEPEYGGLVLTEASRAVLRGEAEVHLRRERRPAPRGRSARRTQKQTASNWSGPASEDEALFEKLRALRKDLADTQGVPSYIVFSNTTLQAMTRFKPQTEEELSRISGVGAKKLERYGEAFLAILQQY